MHDSHETRSAVRQPCPDSSWGPRTLAVLALLFSVSACTPSSWGCVDSKDCSAGFTCVHWAPGQSEEERYCAKSCPVEANTCDTGEACSCPDSPAKMRCFDDDGNRIGVCEGRFAPGS